MSIELKTEGLQVLAFSTKTLLGIQRAYRLICIY